MISNRYAWDQLEVYRGWILRDAITPEELRKRYWQEQRSIPEISKISKINKHVLYELMRKHGISRRTRSESNYLVYRDKPAFILRKELSQAQRRLKTAGLMLYWGEGAKQHHTVDLANTDPKVILVFLRFLREICGVSESRLRAFLYIYEGQNVDHIRRYWSELTRIPESQFFKPYISRFRSGRVRQKVLPNGVFHIRYSDKRLLQQILSWIEQEAGTLIRAGTQVAKGVRL
ncbi:MAG: hypothetical protein HY211_00415 [Candidatus Omnitrophica bacterium]|nr:hypothetical protein [Candidatus Omnitrophota bacterium]